MATKNVVEERLADIAALVTKPNVPDLAAAPTYRVSGVQEGTEVNSFARANAEERLPQEAVIFYIPQTDKDLVGIVARSIAQASSPDDKLWDPLLTYVEANKTTVRPVVMTRKEAVAEVLRVSQSKGTAVYDQTGTKLKGVYDIAKGFVFTHKPKGQEQTEEEEELILEAEVERTSENLPEVHGSTMLLPEIVSEASAEIENTVAIIRADIPPTKTLEKKVLAVNLTRPLESASKIIAFIFEEDIDSKQVIEPEQKKELSDQSSQITTQDVPAASGGSLFGGAIPDFDKYVSYAPGVPKPGENN